MSITNPATLEPVAESPWIRIGQEYTVLEVDASPERRFSMRVDLGDEVPGLWDSEMFETTDPAIPAAWVAQISEGGTLRLAPPRWLVPGFWEQYFDDEPAAVAVFEEDRRSILGESEAAD
ncbi:hypothetical protein [Kribbella sp. CA-293567]|uniref:hypothetical protein n=1 Tax=Kribbella sp. CA-293567 TaxID=3002436 RepID=UPI0022DD59E1|nr:hypothetical protein [Kribbella sp. CA-293567]WBQ07840.1 hypothetical protein OX958_13815 [Kribbella sp. CA-293567]